MNENDNLNQNNLNEETTNETTNTQESQTTDTNTTSDDPVKHSKIIEVMINASDNPEESRKEWDGITKDFQDAKNEVVADITKKKTLKERISDILAILIIVGVVALIFRGCSANSPENRAIKNAQNLVFEDYGGTNFDIYVGDTLTDVTWEAEKLGKDRWAVYMSGYSPEYDLQLMVQIVLTYGNGVHPVLSRPRIGFERGLFHDTLLRAEHEVMRAVVLRVLQMLDPDESIHLVIGLNVEQILYSATLACLVTLRYLIDFQPIAPPLLGEEEHSGMHRCGINILDEILVARIAPLRTYAAPILRLEVRQRRSLDISQMGYGDNHLIVRVEVFRIELLARIDNLCAAGIAVFLFQLNSLVLNDFHTAFDTGKYVFQVLYPFQDILIFRTQLGLFHARELAQAHLNYVCGLPLAQTETLHQARLGLVRSFRLTYDTYGLIEVVEYLHAAFEQFGPLLRLAQLKLSAARDNIVPMGNEMRYQFLNIEELRAAVDQGYVVDAE